MVFQLGISFSTRIIFGKKSQLAIITIGFLYAISALFCDFIIPAWESQAGQLVETISLMSFLNLMFRSTLIIIYSDDRCDFESIVLTYFKSEEDMLWIWFSYLIYQIIFFHILGYFALYIQANYKTFNFMNLFDKKKSLKMNQLEKTRTLIRYDHDDVANDDENSDLIDHLESNSDNKILLDSFDQNQNVDIKLLINSEKTKRIALTWNNLSFTLNKKLILRNLNGNIYFGTITAIMGQQKATLLQCIYKIKCLGLSKETEFYVNKFIKIRPVFISQQSTHYLLMNLTVKESLKYSSLLKNNKFLRKNLKLDQENDQSNNNNVLYEFNHNLNVNRILSELMLTNCADKKISQCSREEQKRLLIGLELTPRIKPNLMFIDQPTSGLDIYAAEQVCSVLN